jgi:hypothetical protein
MQTINIVLVILLGLLVRLAIPILLTGLAVYGLKKLDEHWQSETLNIPAVMEKPECWNMLKCPPEARVVCAGFLSTQPCWQVFQLPNGRLREACALCKVFRAAPLPAVAYRT